MKYKPMMLFAVVGVSLGLITFAGFSHSETQSPKHRIVFEVNSAGQDQWQVILNNIENVQKAFGPENTEIEVVVHGKALGLLLAKDNVMQERLDQIAHAGVVFAACENTMRRMNAKKEDLLPFAITVDAGVAEVVRKQEQGWAYIKAGL